MDSSVSSRVSSLLQHPFDGVAGKTSPRIVAPEGLLYICSFAQFGTCEPKCGHVDLCNAPTAVFPMLGSVSNLNVGIKAYLIN